MMYYNSNIRRGGICPATERRTAAEAECCREEMIKAFHNELNELRTSIARVI